MASYFRTVCIAQRSCLHNIKALALRTFRREVIRARAALASLRLGRTASRHGGLYLFEWWAAPTDLSVTDDAG